MVGLTNSDILVVS